MLTITGFLTTHQPVPLRHAPHASCAPNCGLASGERARALRVGTPSTPGHEQHSGTMQIQKKRLCTHLRSPVSHPRLQLAAQSKESRGTQTAHLPLLPSGPDGVRCGSVARGLRPRRRRRETIRWAGGPQSGNSTLLKRIAGYRAPLAPRLAQPGGADGSRTHDLQSAILALSQLSYGPTYFNPFPLPTGIASGTAERGGFEPPVAGLPQHTLSKRAPSASRTPLRNRQSNKKPVECWPYAPNKLPTLLTKIFKELTQQGRCFLFQHSRHDFRLHIGRVDI